MISNPDHYRVDQAISLLRRLIKTPSFSKEEGDTAQIISEHLSDYGFSAHRHRHNVWAIDPFFSDQKPTLLLNSHHDTVKPNPAYSRDPFSADIENGKLFGLGSNDAGGCLVSLLTAFILLAKKNGRLYNLVFLASAEEEISGKGGIAAVFEKLPPIAMAIVGEPTLMHAAIAEKGLAVLDCTASGIAGHAAREEGTNAIYQAWPDIDWFRTYAFPKKSDTLGDVKMSVTQISSGSQHNVVPASCHFVVDVRLTDAYAPEEVLEVIRENVKARVEPRSLRLRPSGIATDHPLVKAAEAMGCQTFGSATLSDQALIPCPSIKIGPGDSARSHTANEFIFTNEIAEGIRGYLQLMENLDKELSL